MGYDTAVIRYDLRLGDKAEWIKVFDPRDSTIFMASNDPASIGDQVRIDLTVGDSGPRVILRGKVIARRTKGDGALAKGCTIALGPEEREKVNYLNGYIRGGLLDLRTRRRLPIRLRVSYGGISGAVESYTRDINEEGIFVVAQEPLPEDSEVHLYITFPGRTDPVSVIGVVSHTVVIEDEDLPGMGIRFTFDGGASDDFCDMVDKLEVAFVGAKLPDEYLE